MKKYIPYTFLVLIILSVLIFYCAVNPVTGKREFMLLSEADEINLGKKTDVDVIKMYGIYPDDQLNTYVSFIGKEMGKLSHRPHLSYEFKIMDTPVINAFAVPGGYVYFTRGILAYLNSEAELAGVMGHEIGHITARHSAKQYSNAQLAQLGLGIGIIVSDTFRKYAGLAEFGVGMIFLKFSRENEEQADALGVEYSTKAGYNSSHMANFFETLDRMHPSENRSGLNEWFSTHPNPDDRVIKVREMAQNWKAKMPSQNFKVGRNEYIKKIDGIVFGDDPRHGYEENNMFYHPDMRFQFSVPQNWKLYNTPSQVQIINEPKDAALIFALGEGSSPADVATKFITNSGAAVLSRNNIQVNGLQAQKVLFDVTSQDDVIRILSYFISMEKYVFIFQGMSARANFENYQSVFEKTIGSFKRLTNQKKINVQPDRIRVRTVKTAGILGDILLNFGVKQDELEQAALINGKKLSDQVEVNTLLKTVEKVR